jgi:2-polyprenyl-6-hydroxyphenyl methylase/3-demethylubiquinone-9 3-methyltransferase
MTFDDFKNHLSNLPSDGNFTFGKNWLDYVRTRVTPEIVQSHVQDLIKLYKSVGLDVTGKSVIDVGCGSGLSSLSFALMHSARLLSIDIDQGSVDATRLCKSMLPTDHKFDWSIQQKSVFDLNHNNGVFDLVYSWGVLHHTGDVWGAVKRCQSILAPGGYLHLALYRSGDRYTEHVRQKTGFLAMSRDEKVRVLYDYLNLLFMSKGASVFDFDERGMNRFHDALDWFGGFPYEVVDPEVLGQYLQSCSIRQIYLREASQGGCFVYIGRKSEFN